MTKCKFYSDKNGLYGFCISGHSGYDVAGQDIICAAISSATQLVINTLTDFYKIKADVSVNEKNAKTSCVLDKSLVDDKSRLLLESFRAHILQLCAEYKNYVTMED